MTPAERVELMWSVIVAIIAVVLWMGLREAFRWLLDADAIIAQIKRVERERAEASRSSDSTKTSSSGWGARPRV